MITTANEDSLIFTEIETSYDKQKHSAIVSSTGVRVDFPSFVRVYAFKDFMKINENKLMYTFKLNPQLTFKIYKEPLMETGEAEEAKQLIPIGKPKLFPPTNAEILEFLKQFDKYLPPKQSSIEMPIVFNVEYTPKLKKQIFIAQLMMSGFPGAIGWIPLMILNATNANGMGNPVAVVSIYLCIIVGIFGISLLIFRKQFKHKIANFVIDDFGISIVYDNKKREIIPLKKLKLFGYNNKSLIVLSNGTSYEVRNFIFLPKEGELANEQLTYLLSTLR